MTGLAQGRGERLARSRDKAACCHDRRHGVDHSAEWLSLVPQDDKWGGIIACPGDHNIQV